MSDYWKSLPRKFCDTCKCWFADNKASIEFHEKGKKHKENVLKRITEIQKKGLKEFKKKQKLENEMEKIEKAALKAFQKDMAQNPDLAEQYKHIVIPAPKPKPDHVINKSNKTSKNRTAPSSKIQSSTSASKCTVPSKVWYEGVSEEGDKYYWNSVTSESQWEPPEEGFLSMEEQNKLNEDTNVDEEKAEERIDSCEPNPSLVPDAIGPMPKVDPYGQWMTVKNEVPEHIDLQLPQKSEDIVEAYIPLTKEDAFKIKEKTVGHLSGVSGESTFKKRKNLSSAKRNVRQRFDDS